MQSELQKTPYDTETVVEYIHRICSNKKTLGLTWPALTELVNTQLNLDYSESWYRKGFTSGLFDVVDETPVENIPAETNSDDHINNIQNLLHQQALNKVELSDMLIQNNAYIRRLSREETIKTIAHNFAIAMNSKKKLNVVDTQHVDTSKNSGILLLSDWHYGMVCDNPWNKFDPEVCERRVSELLTKVVNIVKTNSLKHVHVFNLADLIAGRIHTQIRIESRFDVITQTMQVAEILAEFLTELSQHCNVSFYNCLDNHSRLEPNKKESLDLESLVRLIPWFLQERLKDNKAITICSNIYGEDIITCNVAGHNIIGVHGDNDKPTTALERLTLLTHEHYAMLCTAHRHHMFVEEINEMLVIGNSSLMGTDAYSVKLRLSSKPSQTFILVSPENVCECLYRIQLN